jgi:hypothetical protein
MRFLELIEQEITSNNYLNNFFLIDTIRAFDWCMNCYILKKNFGHKGGPLPKKSKYFLESGHDNSYINRKP